MVWHQLSGGVGKVEDPDSFLERLREHHGKEALVVDADLVCGPEHMASALTHAERAFRNRRNAADSLAMETMLYLSGERQLSKAREKVGLRPGTERVAILFLEHGPDVELWHKLGLRHDDSVLEFQVAKAEGFGIGKEEMDTVPASMVQDLVLERVAFVDIVKR
jgi:KEOPS complex subunit Cgi121